MGNNAVHEPWRLFLLSILGGEIYNEHSLQTRKNIKKEYSITLLSDKRILKAGNP